MTRLVIDIDKPSDLEALLLFLNRLNIKFNKNVAVPAIPETPSIELNHYSSLEAPFQLPMYHTSHQKGA
jgi:hypothetical protein